MNCRRTATGLARTGFAGTKGSGVQITPFIEVTTISRNAEWPTRIRSK